jgi:putative heme iron utilization protein
LNDARKPVRRSLDAGSREALISLIREHRWGALATLTDDGEPLASGVAYALSPETDGFLLHLSRLAEHTRNLLSRPVAGLLIGEADPGGGDPQTLRRLSVHSTVTTLEADDPAYAAAREVYISRFPQSEPRFGFADFELFFLKPTRAHYVGGFARAFALDADTLAAVLRACAPG